MSSTESPSLLTTFKESSFVSSIRNGEYKNLLSKENIKTAAVALAIICAITLITQLPNVVLFGGLLVGVAVFVALACISNKSDKSSDTAAT